MKKIIILAVISVMIMALVGCGKETKTDVRTALNDKIKNLNGYKVEGKMALKFGEEPQYFDLEVWYQAPNQYKVNLKNVNKGQSQIILRNPEGVFVLTPALNKSFHFQSEWPSNGSQAYLYQSLVNDVLADKEATYKETKQQYVFETKTNYASNKTLPVQEIAFDKKTLAPASVKVMDVDRKELVTVEFTKIKFNPSFDKDSFNVQKNLTGAQLEIPVMTEEATSAPLVVKYPSSAVAGTEPTSEKRITTDNGEQIVLTYVAEDKSYTLIEQKAAVATTVFASEELGEPIDLGFTIGTLTNNSVSWTYEGTDFLLASNDLTSEELVEVASSVTVASEK